MRIERTVNICNEVGYLVNFGYESFREIAECIANYRGWDDFDYEYDNNILQVWDYYNDEDMVTVAVTEEDEELA